MSRRTETAYKAESPGKSAQHDNASGVTDRPKGATDDRVNGATQSGSFSLLDGVNYWSFFALFSFVVFVPWGQFFGER